MSIVVLEPNLAAVLGVSEANLIEQKGKVATIEFVNKDGLTVRDYILPESYSYPHIPKG